jgi:hypothetical protein
MTLAPASASRQVARGAATACSALTMSNPSRGARATMLSSSFISRAHCSRFVRRHQPRLLKQWRWHSRQPRVANTEDVLVRWFLGSRYRLHRSTLRCRRSVSFCFPWSASNGHIATDVRPLLAGNFELRFRIFRNLNETECNTG